MSIVKLIQTQATKELEAGGLHWRIKRVRSRDVLRAGLASIVQFAPDDIADIMTDSGDDPDAIQEAVASSWASKMAAMSDVQQAKMSDSLDALVCAGVVEASSDGDAWEPIRFTQNEREANPDAAILMIDSLPWPLRQELAAAVQAHSREGMEAEVASVATFRQGAGSGATG